MSRIRQHEVRHEGRRLEIECWLETPAVVGCHWIDPATGAYLRESEWAEPVDGRTRIVLELPPVAGKYRFYVSQRTDSGRWDYEGGGDFLLVDFELQGDGTALVDQRVTTLRRVPRPSRWRRLFKVLAAPFTIGWANRGLIASMVERDILARYRGSIADAFWAVLNPLILMLTYYFIFGVVLKTRFPGDPSQDGFTLYFLAGMLPWLAFSEAVARAPNLAREHRNLITKLIFPVEILPLNLCLAGFVTGLTALLVFFGFLIFARGGVPWTALYLPLVLAPQFLFTAGLCYGLCAAGAFIRDLVYIVSLSLTLLFFLTPICYPESSLPESLVPILTKNPVYQLVRFYRRILVEGGAPDWSMLAQLTALAVVVFYLGFGYFLSRKKSFADVV